MPTQPPPMPLDVIGKQTAARRLQFVASLQDQLHLSAAQRKPLDHLLAAASASRFNIYFFYPHLFRDAFPAVPDETLDDIAWAGRCALDYILLYDYVLDSGRLPDPVLLLASYAFQREYLAVLQRYFPPGSALWGYLAQYEMETARALLEESRRRQTPFAPFTSEDVRRASVGKAALSRLALIALACLTDQLDSDVTARLIQSNDLYNYARQLGDDLLDWRKDYAGQRVSFLLSGALTRLGVKAETPVDQYPRANALGSVLYSQLAEASLQLADTSLADASDLAAACRSGPGWLEVLAGLQAEVREQRAAVVEVLRMAHASRSVHRRQADRPALEPVQAAIEAARNFLLSRQAAEGCWRDFATAAGESEDWVTGYVGWSLGGCRLLPGEAMARAAGWLRSARFPSGGWGYHRSVVVDADSTAWCLRYLCLAQAGGSAGLEDALAALLAHQASDGGFMTYPTPDPIRTWMGLEPAQDLSGWCQSHPCVTAAAMAALLDCGGPAAAEGARRAVDYVLARQAPEGYWRSYWWAGPLYATTRILEALAGWRDSKVQQAVAAAGEWLAGVQHPDGSWGCGPGQAGTPFHTGLAVSGLLAGAGKNIPAVQEAAARGSAWLIRNQHQDGGWASSALLLLPETHEREPWTIDRWPVAIQGTGIARRDHRRIFTTATVLPALYRCAQLARRTQTQALPAAGR